MAIRSLFLFVALVSHYFGSYGFRTMRGAQNFKMIKAPGPQDLFEGKAVSVKKEVKAIREAQQTMKKTIENAVSTVEHVKDAMKKQEKILNRMSKRTNNLESTMKKLKSKMAGLPRTNLALKRPTKASSVYHSSRTSNAVDGKPSSSWYSDSCFAVNNTDLVPWWQVDLGTSVDIAEVTVTARDDCCPGRLHDFAVEVFDKDPSKTRNTKAKLCYMYDKQPPTKGETLNLTCTETLTGRYLRLTGRAKKNPNDALQFCEVEVFGPKLLS